LQKITRQAQMFWHNPADQNRGCVNWDMLIGTGQSLVKLPHFALAMLVMLDIFQPVGISVLALDSKLILPMLGALARVEPLAAAHLARYDSLLKIATVITSFGTERMGKKALTVRLQNIETGQTDSYEVDFGKLEILPNTVGGKFEVDVKCAGKLRLHSTDKAVKKLSAHAEGGKLGIVIDTRGRPLKLPADDVARQTQLQRWLTQIGMDEDKIQWDVEAQRGKSAD